MIWKKAILWILASAKISGGADWEWNGGASESGGGGGVETYLEAPVEYPSEEEDEHEDERIEEEECRVGGGNGKFILYHSRSDSTGTKRVRLRTNHEPVKVEEWRRQFP